MRERGPKIYLLDSGLVRSRGHDDHFARGFLRCAAGCTCEVEVLAHRNASEDIRSQTGARGVFSRSIYGMRWSDPFDGMLTNFHDHARSFARDLESAALPLEEDDVLFLPTATPHELAGVGLWLQQRRAAVKVAALFHWGGAKSHQPGTWAGAFLRMAAKSLDAANPKAVWIGATQQALADDIAPVVGRSVHVMPSLTFFGEGAAGKPRPRTERPLIGALGGIRPAKASHLLPEIIATALRDGVYARFVVQCHDGQGVPEEYQRLAAHPQVTVLDRWLNEAEMDRLLTELDVALMPYSRSTYAGMVSGTFTLAAGYGIPCVVPSATWMAERLRGGEAAGVAYDGEGAAVVLGALKSLLSRLDAHRDRARILAEAWRRRYSAENTVRAVMTWAGCDGA